MSLDTYLSKLFQDENRVSDSTLVPITNQAQQKTTTAREKTTTARQATTAARRRQLPASVRDSVWNNYIGKDRNKHRCLCCKKGIITNRYFHVGHVISVKNGGTDEINNLRPICPLCNHSMGTTNMVEFVKTYGYYVG